MFLSLSMEIEVSTKKLVFKLFTFVRICPVLLRKPSRGEARGRAAEGGVSGFQTGSEQTGSSQKCRNSP